MKTCIVCRISKEDNEFNDEHVIPDSIGGYYHIYSVCISCNGKMGSSIDHKLTNNKFIEFHRHLLGIKGKSGSVPNPFAGTHTLKDDPEQKVQLKLNSDGSFIPKLIPRVPKTAPSNGESFSIVIDKQDADKIDEIIAKFIARNGLTKADVKIEQFVESSNPWIHTTMEIDIHKFKLSILKIAYEFTVDKVPDYFDDAMAIKISQILLNADFEGLNEIKMIGSGLEQKILEPFQHLIELKNDNHYLILFDSSDVGLLCFVKLFNNLALGFIMSDKAGYLKNDGLLVLKNDIRERTAKLFTLAEMVQQVYTPIEYKFGYWLPDRSSVDEFIANDKNPRFSFYRKNDKIPFFDKDGNVKYTDIDLKLTQEHLMKSDKGDFESEIRTEIKLDEELFIRLLPIGKLYQITHVQIIQYHRGKI